MFVMGQVYKNFAALQQANDFMAITALPFHDAKAYCGTQNFTRQGPEDDLQQFAAATDRAQ
jgi:hypothetical protein